MFSLDDVIIDTFFLDNIFVRLIDIAWCYNLFNLFIVGVNATSQTHTTALFTNVIFTRLNYSELNNNNADKLKERKD